MSQLFLFLFLHVLGVAVGLASGLRTRPLLAAALGFAVGLAATVFLELFLLGVGIPFTRPVGALAAVALLAACIVRIARGGPLERAAWRTLASWTLGFVIVGAALTVSSFAIMTYDSHYLVMMGRIVGDDARLAPTMLEHLGDYGIFQVLAQSLTKFTRESFLWGLAPVFSLSTAALFGVLLSAALDALGVRFARRRLAVALVTAATFSCYMLVRHTFYIQTNFGTAAYLFIFCALFWISERERSISALPVAFLALTAVAVHRIEGPLICVLFLSLSLLQSQLPARRLLVGLAGFTLAVVGWYALLGSGVLPDSEFLTPRRCYGLAALTVAFLAYATVATRPRLAFLARLHRYVPALIALVSAVALGLTFGLRFDHMLQSAYGWLHCLWSAPYWKGPSQAIVALALLGLLVPAPPGRWMFVCGVPAYMALILLLSWARTPYYWGMGDSAARMGIHLVPLAFFYFGLKFLPLLGTPQVSTADAADAPSGISGAPAR